MFELVASFPAVLAEPLTPPSLAPTASPPSLAPSAPPACACSLPDPCPPSPKQGRMSKSKRQRFYRLFEDGLILYYFSEGKTDQPPRGSMIMGAETVIAPSDDLLAFKITQPEEVRWGD